MCCFPILGLAFLIVFGLIFVIQFLAMIVHRSETLAHFIARLPYKWSSGFRSSWTFGAGDLSDLDPEDRDKFIVDVMRSAERVDEQIRESRQTAAALVSERSVLLSQSVRRSYAGIPPQ